MVQTTHFIIRMEPKKEKSFADGLRSRCSIFGYGSLYVFSDSKSIFGPVEGRDIFRSCGWARDKFIFFSIGFSDSHEYEKRNLQDLGEQRAFL